MDIVRGISSHLGDEACSPSRLQSLCSQADTKPSIPESLFEEISKELEIETQKKEWASRPRTYFILWQINRINAMNAFIVHGLNDTSIPYKGRSELPNALSYFEASEFLQRQELVYSDILHLEQGTTHCQLPDGDILFERKPFQLGVGSQGSTVVDRVVSKRTAKVYARKRISRKKMFGFDQNAVKIYENELKALKKVADHHHLIKVRGTYTDRKYLVMLLEPVADHNLKQYMNRGGTRNAEEQARFRTYFGCLAHTIRFLHATSIGILHKDIKPENILIKNGHLILTDFGTAFDWSKTGQSMTRSNAGDVRTPRYQSPEVADGEFHRSSDMWSLGVVFLEMVTILRGKTLQQMDEFLAAHGNRVVSIHQNLDAALNWFKPLQEYRGGSPIDNEPLTWIKAMLNRIQFNRLTADALYDQIVAFGDQFCGRCCLEAESDDDDDGYDCYGDDDVVHGDYNMPLENRETGGRHSPPAPLPPLQFEAVKLRNSFENVRVPGSFPANEGGEEEEHELRPRPLSAASSQRETSPLPTAEINKLTETAVERVRRAKKSSRGCSRTSSNRRGASRGQGHGPTTPLAKAHTSPLKTGGGARAKADPFQDRGLFKSWLAALPAKFAMPPSPVRTRALKRSATHFARGLSIGTQRMQHFLSSLPDEPADFEIVSGEFSVLQQPAPPLVGSRTDSPVPSLSGTTLERSNSLEDFQSSSHLWPGEVDGDDDQLFELPKSKLVHYASESNLNVESKLAQENLGEVVKELRSFKIFIAGLVKKAPPQTVSVVPHTCIDAEVKQPEPLETVLQVSVEPKSAPSLMSERLQNSLRESRGQPPLPGSALIPAARKEKTNIALVVSDTPAAPNIAGSPSPSFSGALPGSLGSFIDKVPASPRRRWESASVIMKRVIDGKASVALTSEMSADTRALVSNGRLGMRWNDRTYNYLPYFVARAKLGGVRELLMAGCNPGTREKPRWSPAYNAVMGKTEKHTKCLRVLAAYGADMNATRRSDGRTLLHYAVEHEPWDGYSTVIYILLTAGADPNIRDNAGDLPLLMLLVGNGPLPQEKRDALYLLLAPSFTTDLDVSIAGTLDNPLHLAIRRKDARTVDALLTTMDNVSAHVGSVRQIMHKQNGSGFTPLLLAFKMFNFADEVDDELQIIDLLLDRGANPNDQDATQGETPLHLVIRGSKNTTAFELLCSRSADPRTRDRTGKSPIDLVLKGQADHPNDPWYPFARRRLDDLLTDDDYQPPGS